MAASITMALTGSILKIRGSSTAIPAKARAIMGYTTITLFAGGIVMIAALLIVGAG